MSYRFEVYENNGGALTLAVLNDDDTPAALFEGWEYDDTPGALVNALVELAADPTAWRCWDGDMVERIASEWPYHGEAEPPTLAELYDEIRANDDPILLSDGSLTDPERWGYAARKAMLIDPNGEEVDA